MPPTTTDIRFWSRLFEDQPAAALAQYQAAFGSHPPDEPALESLYWLSVGETGRTDAIARAVLRRLSWSADAQGSLLLIHPNIQKPLARRLADFARERLATLGLDAEEVADTRHHPVLLAETALEGTGHLWEAAALDALTHDLTQRNDWARWFIRATLRFKLAHVLLLIGEQGPSADARAFTIEKLLPLAQSSLALADRPEWTDLPHPDSRPLLRHNVHLWLGGRYEESGDLASAQAAYLAAAQFAAHGDDEVDSIAAAARCTEQMGDPQRALALLATVRERVAAIGDADTRAHWEIQWSNGRDQLGLPPTHPDDAQRDSGAVLGQIAEQWRSTDTPPDRAAMQSLLDKLQEYRHQARADADHEMEFKCILGLLPYAAQFERYADWRALFEAAAALEPYIRNPVDRWQLRYAEATGAMVVKRDAEEAVTLFQALWSDAQTLLPPESRADVARHYLDALRLRDDLRAALPEVRDLVDTIVADYRIALSSKPGAPARARVRASMQHTIESAILTLFVLAHQFGIDSDPGQKLLHDTWGVILATRNPELHVGPPAAVPPAQQDYENAFLGSLRDALYRGDPGTPWSKPLEALWEYEAMYRTDARPAPAALPAAASEAAIAFFQIRDLLPTRHPLIVLRRRAGRFSGSFIDGFVEERLSLLQSLRRELADRTPARLIALKRDPARKAHQTPRDTRALGEIARQFIGPSGNEYPPQGPASYRCLLCDGALDTIPLEALPAVDGAPESTAWGQAEGIVYRLRADGPAPTALDLTAGWLGLAGVPAFGANAELPGSVSEAHAIEALLRQAQTPTRLLLGSAAHGGNLARLLADRRPAVLHIAAHGVASREYPDVCTLVLAADPDSAAGELLSYRQILRLPLEGIGLVVLSACSSSSGRSSRSAGLEGLAWAFLRAGAALVMASRWPVGDRATAKFMTGFYAHLLRQPPVEALRLARCDALAAGMAEGEVYAWGLWG